MFGEDASPEQRAIWDKEEKVRRITFAIDSLISVKIDQALGKRPYYSHTLSEEKRLENSLRSIFDLEEKSEY